MGRVQPVRDWPWFKHQLAANCLDAPRFGLVLDMPRLGTAVGRSWIDLCNRGERLVRRDGQRGVACDWRWSSSLYYCQAYPTVGRKVLASAFRDWPIQLDAPAPASASHPEVSFIVGHRGAARMPHLFSTLLSIAGQADARIECIVVEQSVRPELPEVIPSWVKLIHTPPPSDEMPYSRSWAFNVGAKLARGQFLVLHDNDLLMPERYAAEVIRVLKDFEAARLQRFIFYLNEVDSTSIMNGSGNYTTCVPLAIEQNNHGGTFAIRKAVYEELGGYDEGFVGWGGEDNEFFDRCRTRRLHDCSYLPFVHLYHVPQPGKAAVHPNTEYFEARMKIPAEKRVAELRSRPFGEREARGEGRGARAES